MPCQNTGCIRQYRFEDIAFYARKRYVEGIATIELMRNAKSDHERSLVALASLLDLDDARIRELMPYCGRKCQARLFELRDQLRVMIVKALYARDLSCGKRQPASKSHHPFNITLVPG
jgi:hypothetical protein